MWAVLLILRSVAGVVVGPPPSPPAGSTRVNARGGAEAGRAACGRRTALSLSAAGLAALSMGSPPRVLAAEDGSSWYGSEGILSWVSSDTYTANMGAAERIYPVEFTTYLARFLLNFDASCAQWWRERLATIPRPYGGQQRKTLENKYFAEFAKSVEYGLRRYPGERGPSELLKSLERQHGSDAERRRHLALAFSFLGEAQPAEGIARLLVGVDGGGGSRVVAPPAGWGAPSSPPSNGGRVETILPPAFSPALQDYLAGDMLTLLPRTQRPVFNSDSGLYEVRGLVFGELKQSRHSVDSIFGAEAADAFYRERPLTRDDFALFAVAGAVGCSLTHAVVVPLDVVKTRQQTDPAKFGPPRGLGEGLALLVRDEGWPSLLTGAAPTMLGYLWYGLTVYPGYELLKRALFDFAGPADAIQYRSALVLLAGASATIVACVGVCPAEICRIRMVSQPAQYATLAGTVQSVVGEGGAAALYRGFRPLLVRQIIFGMVKFFFFDTCADAIFDAVPELHASVESRLLVSVLAGLIAGTASSLFSQPADTVLSTMNKNKNAKPGTSQGIFATAKTIFDDYGLRGFYLGAGARCLWSGAVISGQFFFYDLVRSAFEVSSDDLRLHLDINL